MKLKKFIRQLQEYDENKEVKYQSRHPSLNLEPFIYEEDNKVFISFQFTGESVLPLTNDITQNITVQQNINTIPLSEEIVNDIGKKLNDRLYRGGLVR